jgi:hypothetical protein
VNSAELVAVHRILLAMVSMRHQRGLASYQDLGRAGRSSRRRNVHAAQAVVGMCLLGAATCAWVICQIVGPLGYSLAALVGFGYPLALWATAALMIRRQMRRSRTVPNESEHPERTPDHE